jgi:hypothetical protein
LPSIKYHRRLACVPRATIEILETNIAGRAAGRCSRHFAAQARRL